MANYKVLPVAPTVFKVLAWLGVALGLISCIAILIGGGTPQAPRWMGIVSLVVGTIYFFLFMVFSEGIRLLLEIKDKVR